MNPFEYTDDDMTVMSVHLDRGGGFSLMRLILSDLERFFDTIQDESWKQWKTLNSWLIPVPCANHDTQVSFLNALEIVAAFQFQFEIFE